MAGIDMLGCRSILRSLAVTLVPQFAATKLKFYSRENPETGVSASGIGKTFFLPH